MVEITEAFSDKCKKAKHHFCLGKEKKLKIDQAFLLAKRIFILCHNQSSFEHQRTTDTNVFIWTHHLEMVEHFNTKVFFTSFWMLNTNEGPSSYLSFAKP